MLAVTDRGQRSLLQRLIVATVVVAAVSLSVAFSAPTITIWYGNNQAFGQLGNPQTAINILGNVSDPNGISSLSYTLNGGPSVSLSRGPDTRRLLKPGDFNVDIDTENLTNGTNLIIITAVNVLNETSVETVTVQYTAGNIWPGNYMVNWSAASSIQSVAQVVDGHWTLTDTTVRPTYLGYDRLIAIGDKNWTDYEVTVPIIFYGIDTAGFTNPSNGPGIGLLLRWTGHTDNPISGWQPKSGYLPLGAIGWYQWHYSDPSEPPRLRLLGNNLTQLGDAGPILSFNTWYYFKMRVETIQGVGGLYSLKVWEVSQPEPSNWLLQGQQGLSDPQNGSVLLVSHHVDAEFGNVSVTQLAPPLPVQLTSFTATVQPDNSVRLDWVTISELNNYGFEVQKSQQRSSGFATIPNSFVPGHGTTLDPQFYSFVDRTAMPGDWFYRLKQIDLDGTLHYSDPIAVSVVSSVPEDAAPRQFILSQNYPNPFNPETHITYSLPAPGVVQLEVFDLLGQRVASLVNEFQAAGTYTCRFDGSFLPSGAYVYRLRAHARSLARTMLLIR